MPARPEHPVLVLDADQVSALAIVRSLARSGRTVDTAAADDDAIAARSRHVRHHHVYPNPLTQAEAFVAWVADQQQRCPQMLVVPVTERSLVVLMRARHRLPLVDRIAMAPAEALEQVLDKSRTVALAQRLDVPVPASEELANTADIERFLTGMAGNGWSFPLVVKPSRSVGQQGGAQPSSARQSSTAQSSAQPADAQPAEAKPAAPPVAKTQGVQLSVAYARNATEFTAEVKHALQYGQVIIQEYFRGDGVGIELIADRGEIAFAFQHRRLHEVPLTGGGSSLRISDPVHPRLLEASRALIRALGWHGVAMVEFKQDPVSGDFRLMEINGRFWGSLPLAIAAGADFPVMLAELMDEGAVRPRPPARTGVVARQLARDLDWLEHVLRGAAPAGLVELPTKGQVLKDCALVFSPRHHFDAQSLSDPMPGLVDIARIVRKQWARVQDQLAQRMRLKAEWKRSRQRQAALAATPGHQPVQVLFLCYGNINRSALAHAYAAAFARQGLTLASAGFHAPEGRPADPQMVETAAGHGVGLGDSRSRTLDADMVDAADVILAMEVKHLDRLQAEYPGAQHKAFLLGAPLTERAGGSEIADPYGRPRSEYERVCQQVLRAVDAWLKPMGAVGPEAAR